jgi:hypothetical protein
VRPLGFETSSGKALQAFEESSSIGTSQKEEKPLPIKQQEIWLRNVKE